MRGLALILAATLGIAIVQAASVPQGAPKLATAVSGTWGEARAVGAVLDATAAWRTYRGHGSGSGTGNSTGVGNADGGGNARSARR